jgi:hypothetical protein
MTITDFCGVLTAFEAANHVPFRHYTFSKPTPPPCIAWLEMDGDSVHGDGVNVQDEVYIRLELYIRPEDETTPAALEAALTSAGLSYERDRAWIDERHEVMVIYEINLT